MSLNGSINDEILAEMNAGSSYEAPTDGVPGDGVTVSSEEPGKVPDIDSAIQEIAIQDNELKEDQASAVRVGQMKEVADRVIAAESISISDAEEIQRVYGDLDKVAPVESYSATPTKVNLVPTKRFVENRLGEEAGHAVERHLAYVNNTYQSASTLLKLLETHVGELLCQFEVFRGRCGEDLTKASVSKRFLAFRRPEEKDRQIDGPYDLKKVCLYNQNFVADYEAEGLLDKLPTSEEISDFREVYFSDAFKSLLRYSERHATNPIISLHRAFHNTTSESQSSNGVCYVDLLTLFASGKIEDLLGDYLAGVKACGAAVDAEYAKLTGENASAITAWTNEFRESTQMFNQFYEMLLQLEKYRMVCYMFLYRSVPIIEGFGSAL